MCGTIISHPFDVVKTTIQRSNTPVNISMTECFAGYLKSNPLALWTGIFPRCIQVMMSMGIGSVVFYELV
ncbi:MAG TPA: hypothetical protein EYO58_00125 [Flavobacteriales bacterium]|nr:hypothetical protein [Flavobacteriales bacterium]